ncbi:MAG: hypothetical protein PHG05_04310 [Candidatus Nanoarchaeia archaeon]|nr:hypothetical protein [Candidatus Nanoarchaeia archaeon]
MYKCKTKHYEILDNKNEITKDIINKCNYAYNKNKRFFGKDCSFFRIRLANSEDEFKRLAGKFYNPWVKGVGKNGNFVVIRNIELYDKCYKKFKGTEKFEILLTHEINHIYAEQLNVYKGPYWFTEGLAMYVAGQVPGKTYKKKVNLNKENIKKLLFYRLILKKINDRMYVPQYYGVRFLISEFGKDRLVRLINSYHKKMNKKQYENRFKEIYGISYNRFINKFAKKERYN